MVDHVEILIAEIQGLYEDGFSVAEISWGLNLSKEIVRRVIASA